MRWFLSINYQTIPEEVRNEGKRTYRSISIDGESFEFSDGFTDLHTHSYKEIIEGRGFRISETEKAIQSVYDIRRIKPIGLKGEYHPAAALPLCSHPFSVE